MGSIYANSTTQGAGRPTRPTRRHPQTGPRLVARPRRILERMKLTDLDNDARAALAAMPAHELTALLAELRSPDELSPQAAAAAAVRQYQAKLPAVVADALARTTAAPPTPPAAPPPPLPPLPKPDDLKAAAAQALAAHRASSPTTARTAYAAVNLAGINTAGDTPSDSANAIPYLAQHYPIDQTD